ncbi:3-dehydroquinate synthase [Pontibacter sp. 172403-2]|uniref:3-dehydroquinate synthase n=1 Tax=Pontibacter rufus TaxID=2791028 RepID=UPI0018AF8538|nr:3-dehydroquinate synthase [Pontibacter sp. 172403-2]MBF9254488.1 3-dehydroquinate synthase [Pontibacter sp. 172403-2]
MRIIQQSFQVQFNYGVFFTEGMFNPDNRVLLNVLQPDGRTEPIKLLFVIDSGVAAAHPSLVKDIKAYAAHHADTITLPAEPLILPGGEDAKNNPQLVQDLLEAVNNFGICRHSYLVAIGGGALLDMAGFAAAVAHRGIRLIRIPTTVLAQNDSGVGVKNSVNAFHKKNFLGTFAPPVAVINDSDFLLTLEDRDWRAGISEAIKVALIKDADFYTSIKQNAAKLVARDMPAMQDLIFRCAEMHTEHISGKDPFEKGSSRPLDFGHWAAHKLEQLTEYRLRHGEAVAIGIALDVVYSMLAGMLSKRECEDVLELISTLGFDLYVPELSQQTDAPEQALQILKGLSEFREHLGGQLTIMLLNKIGEGVEVHHMDEALLIQAVKLLQERQQKAVSA